MRPGFRLRTLTLPDAFLEHDDQFKQYDAAGLNAADIAKVVENSLVKSA
jgi:1-deoxy-D-xylulose-5-phosphate synthase